MIKLYVMALNGLRAMRDERGQDLIEYALLGALIAIVSAATMTTLGTTISGGFTVISGYL